MDTLIALRILGLESEATGDEIKQAYAELSKIYHPEDFPEKFQQIHEAYKVLTRRRQLEQNLEPVYEEKQEQEYNFKFQNLETEEDEQVEQEREYSFESVLEREELKNQEKLHEVVLKALAEMKILLQPAYCEKITLFKKFFKNDQYQEALHEEEFIGEFTKMLQHVTLKKSIYHEIIRYYHLRNVKVENLSSTLQLFYKTINGKCSIKQTANPLWLGVIPIIVFRAIRTSMRNCSDSGDMIKLVGVLAVLAGIVAIIIWGYKKLHENHSSIFAQIILSLLLTVTHFLIVGFDLYGKLFGDIELGVFIASMICAGSFFWFCIVCALALFKKVIQMFRSRM